MLYVLLIYDLRVLVMCLCMSPTLTIFSIFLQPYNEESKKERKRVKEMDAFKEREKNERNCCLQGLPEPAKYKYS